MPDSLNFKISRYAKIEISFFLLYFYVVGLLSSFEYNLWEKGQFGISKEDLEFGLVYGTFNLIAFFIFYRCLQKCLVIDKIWAFVVLILSFMLMFFFFKKASYLLISKLDFLSVQIRTNALKWYHLKRLGFTVSYMMTQFFGVAYLAYFIHSARQNEQIKTLREEQLASELTYLKAQLQPHFFFNTLNNIYSFALRKADQTAPLVSKLAEMMRYILYHADKQMVPLKDEIDFIRNYVEVETIRYRKQISIGFEMQGVDHSGEISPLLLLPFVENAFKHGIQEEEGSGFVNIVIHTLDQELTMEVKNSISKTESKAGGIGLMNVRKRLEILYPGRHTLNIYSNGTIHEVSLTLKMK
ncbi:sensor histidine kinase [Pedobacter sp.]|uniref:sensor histidine kinase n=1 Tax=Pedobacter sp. TaxID=1411316 RepID=UPI003BA93A9D